MLKPKPNDWKDTNVALFGSDTDKKVKKESALGEPAWKNAGKKIGIQIWRIIQFKVKPWTKEDYGKFFNGDSYIILNTYKEAGSDELQFDLHFWIGKYSTADEYGTAAYKTVELDTLLDDKAVQHREVQGNESTRFRSYFEHFTIMKGGAESGFRHVVPENYKPRLYHISGEKKQINITEVPLKRGNLNSEDVFVIDCGLRIFQFNGETANKDEKFKTTQFVQKLKADRMGKPKLEILDEKLISKNHKMWQYLSDGKSKEKEEIEKNPVAIFVVSDAGGKIAIKKRSDELDKSTLNSDDAFIIETGERVFVWIGNAASIEERRNAMGYAHQYLQDTPNPLESITVLSENQSNADFDAIW